jgi:predicted esterase
MIEPREHHMRVQRSARWYELGGDGAAVREIWLVVHGYAQLARDFIEVFEPIATPARLIVAPEALSRFYAHVERGGTHQQARVGATWMTREDRDAEILDYVDYLDAVVERARAAAPGARRVVALGFSQGTATVSRWAVLGARAPDRLILWGGGPAEDLPADRLSERFGTRPVEIVHGLHDRVVPLAGVERAATRLRAYGVAIELRSYEGGHRIDPALLASVAAA